MTNETQTVVDALVSQEIEDVAEYAARALRVLRRIRDAETWLRVYERGLREAYRRHDMDGLAAMVSLVAYRFDGGAQLDQVLSHFDFALAMADGLPDATTVLQSLKAPVLMASGDREGAQDALRIAAANVAASGSDRARIEYATYSAAVACFSIDASSLPSIRRAVGLAEQTGNHGSAAYVMSWLVPLMFALGGKDEADPWIRALTLHAEELGHPYRMADAHCYAVAARATLGPLDEGTAPALAMESRNWMSAFRLAVLRFRDSILRGEWELASECYSALDELRSRIDRAAAATLPCFQAILEAFESPSELHSPSEPDSSNLVNLAGVLAAGEAVAIAGTQRDAVKWLNWIEKSVPPEVRTSLEWPVVRDRVVGLLRVRAGSVREAVRAFRDAIDWASRAGYEAEAALAQVQLAEVLSLSEIASSERARQRLRKAGWMKLQELNIDPTPHAYAATRALALREDVSTRPQLTPRQVEVLSLLAGGMTYRQAAGRLGTSWRTVSTQAYQAYERLGVSGKHEAIEMARQLQIL